MADLTKGVSDAVERALGLAKDAMREVPLVCCLDYPLHDLCADLLSLDRHESIGLGIQHPAGAGQGRWRSW